MASEPLVASVLAQLEAAPRDANPFVELMGEGPAGRPLRQDPVHREWQELWTQHDRSVLFAPIGHGKTTQLRLRLLWEIGRNPNIQIAFIGASERHPKRVLRALKADIERNNRLRQVFPQLEPAEPWGAKEVQVQRDSRDPDATLAVFGLFGKLLGSRADLVVLDDVCNFENTLTSEQREKAFGWMGEVLSRLRPGARVIAIGHTWHAQDVLHRLGRKDGWTVRRDEALVEGADGDQRALAPSVLTVADIERKRRELGPRNAELMPFNRMVSDGASRFRMAWWERALQMGRGLGFAEHWSGSPTYSGVDLGHRKRRGADVTAIVTAALLPEGTRQVLDVRSGHWSGPEVLRELQDVHRRFGSVIAVENNGAQQLLLDFAHELDAIPLKPHATNGANKHDVAHGVEALGLQLAQGRWMFPCDDELRPPDDVAELIRESLAYDPQRHAGDRLMAWWICAEAIRHGWAAQLGPLELEHVDSLLRDAAGFH